MTDSQDFEFEQLVQEMAPGSRLLRTWRLKGGISAAMTALEIENPDCQRSKWVVRRHGPVDRAQNPHIAADEFRLLHILQEANVAAPRPLHLDPSGVIFPTPYLVLEYVEGEPEFAPSDLADCIRQMAAHLARIHRVDGTRWDLTFLPRQTAGCSADLDTRPTRIDDSLDEGRIRAALAAAGPPPQRDAFVLLHGDFWPGNTLWYNNRLAAVIDWEDARLGDPLVDLANSRLEIAWIFGIEACQWFTQHYRSQMDVDLTHLPYCDLCAALRLIRLADADLAGLAAFFWPWGRTDITEQTIRAHYRVFINQAFEKLQIQA